MEKAGQFAYKGMIEDMCNLRWRELSKDGLTNVAWAYYYFSVHFRECMENALRQYPDDKNLQELDRGERNTDNLSPWPGVARPEKNWITPSSCAERSCLHQFQKTGAGLLKH